MSDPRLGRRVEHDERSRSYGVRRHTLHIESRQWTSSIPVLDQGNLGSCTGNAAVGCLGYEPYYHTIHIPLIQSLAVDVYSEATRLDEFDGEYPPTDTGSSGLAVAKALHRRELISGYRHAFGILDVLSALMSGPLIVGTNWYTSMFYVYAGVVTIGGRVEGGHEYVVDGWHEATDLFSFRNSWGASWGESGRFQMSSATFDRLLREDGDATVFVPVTEPAPVPVPPEPPPPGCANLLAGWGRG